MTDRRFYSGNTVDQALMKASRDLDIPVEELAYRKIEKKHGFLKLRRNVVIEVDPTASEEGLSDDEALRLAQEVQPEIEAKAEPQRPARAQRMVDLPEAPQRVREKFPEAVGESADATRESLEMLLALAGAEMESSVLQGDGRLEIELWGPDQERLLKDRGRPLLGIQHLLVRMARGITGESVFCRVDCDQFHELREERLRDLAQRVASQVHGESRPRLLESMAPDERRIVHMTLANDPHVDTESQGNGFFKRVKIRPA